MNDVLAYALMLSRDADSPEAGERDAAALLDLFGDKERLNAAVSELAGTSVKEERGPPPWDGAVFDSVSHRWKNPDAGETVSSGGGPPVSDYGKDTSGTVVPMPTITDRKSFIDAVSVAAGANPMLSEKGRVGRASIVEFVANRMPDAAFATIGRNLRRIRSCRNAAEVTEAFYDGESSRPDPNDDSEQVWGFFDPQSGEVAIDGGFGAAHEDTSAHSIYAHEFAHVVDYHPTLGYRGSISSTDEFKDAWQEEMADGQLCDYATVNVREGFAEFARSLWVSDIPHETLRDRFPKTWAVFDSEGLI